MRQLSHGRGIPGASWVGDQRPPDFFDISAESRAAYDEACEEAANSAEIAYLARRRDQLG